MLGHGQAEVFSTTRGTSHILSSTSADSRLRAGKGLGVIHPTYLPSEEIRFGEGGVGAQALIKQNQGAIHHSKDFKIASFCSYDNPEVSIIIFPT